MGIVILLVMIILPIIAQVNVNSTFKKYKNVRNSRGLTADQVARQILDSNGLYNVRIERISGELTDHYDPKDNVVRLSDAVYGQTSVAAIGVAAHECGHACQHAQEYTPIKIRTAIVPITNICSRLWYFVFILGILLFEIFPELALIGIIMFGAVVLFQAVTLPVELDASGRALKTLEADGILDYNEVPMAQKVLKAAAFTYVTALVTSVLQLIRLLASIRRN
ncbi:MAG: zinc metallopeptidase [Ruminococcus flavefaciens]|nr:zinc metallopeptidase [Ruminococcus flavefaciens]MCM1360617.1 zinc metallopeptidase [Clostridiales bacterium]MCM1435199.1 zinc metallopeptidase [Ruminococcus flavefaciens]